MPIINVTVAEKIATNTTPDVAIVCGNSDYTIDFTFDDEWKDLAEKTARFVWTAHGEQKFTDIKFTGRTVKVPILSGIDKVRVGVFGGNLHATTPVYIPCDRSVRCDL